MTVQSLALLKSGDSDEDMVSLPTDEELLYRRKFQLLLERCEVIQQDNERIINRIHEVKKITKRCRKDIKLLVGRLDRHGDAFRRAVAEVEIKTEPQVRSEAPSTAQNPPNIPQHKFSQQTVKTFEKLAATSKKPAPKRKSKAEKPEKDPNAPKKPCNAFFQFCQEQRPLVMGMAGPNPEPGVEPSKQEVTRQLASRWRALSTEDKSVYVAMFERSKEKYAEEMSAYIKKEQ